LVGFVPHGLRPETLIGMIDPAIADAVGRHLGGGPDTSGSDARATRKCCQGADDEDEVEPTRANSHGPPGITEGKQCDAGGDSVALPSCDNDAALSSACLA